jgi:hypothetical protein
MQGGPVPDKQLSLNQQLALLPVAVPDSVVDFLEDFNYATALQTDNSRSAFDPDYLKNSGDQLKADLEKWRADLGRLKRLQVEQAGRDIPGGFLLQLDFEKGSRGVGLLTRLKERTILKVMLVEGEYDETALKEQLKNPK